MTANNENEHLLENNWVLWFRSSETSGAAKDHWAQSQQKKFTAGTVEDFWREFHKQPRILAGHPASDYSLFKEGVDPAWEDPFNEQGGRWTFNLERRAMQLGNTNISAPSIIEQVWLDVMLCLIGEGFDPYGEKIAGGVCGIRLPKNVKCPSDQMTAKIHIWTKDASDTEANMKIGEILKSVLNAPPNSLSYSPHDTRGRGVHSQYSLKL